MSTCILIREDVTAWSSCQDFPCLLAQDHSPQRTTRKWPVDATSLTLAASVKFKTLHPKACFCSFFKKKSAQVLMDSAISYIMPGAFMEGKKGLAIKKGEGGSFQGSSVKPTRLQGTRPEPCKNAIRVWPVGRALSCEEGQEIDTLCSRLFFGCQVCDLPMVHAECFSCLQSSSSIKVKLDSTSLRTELHLVS